MLRKRQKLFFKIGDADGNSRFKSDVPELEEESMDLAGEEALEDLRLGRRDDADRGHVEVLAGLLLEGELDRYRHLLRVLRDVVRVERVYSTTSKWRSLRSALKRASRSIVLAISWAIVGTLCEQARIEGGRAGERWQVWQTMMRWAAARAKTRPAW